MPPTISDYYRAALEDVKKEVGSTPDDRVIGMEPEEWINYLVQKWGMEEIVLDDSREAGMTEVESEHRLRGYDIHTNQGPGTVVRSTAVRVEVPVMPSDTIQAIWKHELSPNTFSIATTYPEFDYDHSRGYFSDVVQPAAAEVRNRINHIKASIRAYNESIKSENPGFRQQVVQLVTSKRNRVQEKHRNLDDLATAVGIPLTKKADISTVIPTAPKVRSTVAPVLPPASKPPTRPVLEAAKFAAILDLIDNQGRQFERTPQSYQQLTEEGLRDIILGSLNAVFEGAAGGETFQGIGKVDIHLRITQGEVFVSEIKFWDGPESLREVIKQLRGRLTWRDSYGVALVLSRNAGFSNVLNAVREATPSAEGFVAGSLNEKAANHFVTRFTIPSDEARQANIHVLVYNLYVPEPPRRVVRRVARSSTARRPSSR